MVRKKFNKKEIIIGVAWATIVLIVLTFYIWNQVESVRLGYKIGKLEENLQTLGKDVEKLEAKKSSLLSLERVERIAKDKLKLEKPKKEQVIYDDFSPHP